MANRFGDLPDEWRDALKDWAAVLDGDDTLVEFYEDDGTDSPDVWESAPHLAVTQTGAEVARYGHMITWPVGYEGWADPREIGWDGAARLLAEGKRKP